MVTPEIINKLLFMNATEEDQSKTKKCDFVPNRLVIFYFFPIY